MAVAVNTGMNTAWVIEFWWVGGWRCSRLCAVGTSCWSGRWSDVAVGRTRRCRTTFGGPPGHSDLHYTTTQVCGLLRNLFPRLPGYHLPTTTAFPTAYISLPYYFFTRLRLRAHGIPLPPGRYLPFSQRWLWIPVYHLPRILLRHSRCYPLPPHWNG